AGSGSFASSRRKLSSEVRRGVPAAGNLLLSFPPVVGQWVHKPRAQACITCISIFRILRGDMLVYSSGAKGEDTVERVIKAQEEERRRVARDIHDGPAQMMANSILQLEIVERLISEDPSRALEEIRDLRKTIAECLREIRRIIFDLRPMMLDDLGLAPALRRYISDFSQRHGLHVEMNVLGKEARIDPIIELVLFRIVQEALHNARKHALASKVVVTLGYGVSAVGVSIEDDGKGFDLAAVSRGVAKSEKFGIAGMKERAKLLGGSLDIDTAPGRGTRVTVRIPIEDYVEGGPAGR
ncbi:MAG: sensor histidine kinase, partial [Betaproteobacteria bacterium]